jgi:protein SCO1/2
MSRRNVIDYVSHFRLQHLRLQILCLVAAAIWLVAASVTRAAAPVTVGGPFTLTAPDGTTVTDQTYRDKWLLVFFGYTFCPNICPTTLVEIASALEQLGSDAERLQAIFITVDPARDTPSVLATYTASFDNRIVGLTGTDAQIANVAKAYGAYYAAHRAGSNADDYVMDHGTYIYVMNPQGNFVRAFDADTEGEHIAKSVRELIKHHRGGAVYDRSGAMRSGTL